MKEVTRQFSYFVALPKAIIGKEGAVYSEDAIIAGSGCGDMKFTFCNPRAQFLGRKKVKEAVVQVARSEGLLANTTRLSTEWSNTLQPSFWLAGEVAQHSKSTNIVIVLSTPYTHTYYHWLIEVVPRLWAMRYWIREVPSIQLLVEHKSYGFIQETLAILDISEDRLQTTQSSEFFAADWALIPAGSGCFNHMLASELGSFAAYATGVSLERNKAAAMESAADRPKLVRLPQGLVSESEALHIVVDSAFRSPPNHNEIFQVRDVRQAEQHDPVPTSASQGNNRLSTLSQPRDTGRDPAPPPSLLWQQLGSTHADVLCEEKLLDDMSFRSHPGLSISASEVAKVKSSIHMNYTTAVAGLDNTCRARRNDQHKLVLFLKGASTKRWLVNHNEVKSWLSSSLKGKVTLVVVSSHSMLTQSVLFRCADLIVAPHGSGLSALIFARRGAALIEILPGSQIERSPPCYFQIALTKGIQYSAATAEGSRSKMRLTWKALRSSLEEVNEI